jgi:hypothetical protein
MLTLMAAWQAVEARFGLQRFAGDGRIFALDAIENFGEQFVGVAWWRCLQESLEWRNSGPHGSTSKPLATSSSAICSKMTIWRGESSNNPSA